MKRMGMLVALASLLLWGLVPFASAADVTGRASIGGSGGAMMFLSGSDFGNGDARLIGQGIAKYAFSPKWAVAVESGWGWNAYPGPTSDLDTLVAVVPTTAGLEYRMRYGESKFWPHFGGGVGLYSIQVKDSYRTIARSPVSGAKLSWTSPGFYLKAGGEFVFENFAAINLDLLYHQIFSDDGDKYAPLGWGNQNTSFLEFRIGGSYYFSLGDSQAVPEGE